MEQLICHLFGDYILQSHWMATNKTVNKFACFAHVVFYGIPFLFLKPSVTAFLVIVGTHFVIDHYRLARFVIYAKNFIAPESETFKFDEANLPFGKTDEFADEYKWENCNKTGFHNDTPPFLAVWLLIIVDNSLHLAINFFALKYL